MVLASRRGGVEIEEVAASDPTLIVREAFDVLDGPTEALCASVAQALECSGLHAESCHRIIHASRPWLTVQQLRALLSSS